eukprot:CAMPEP_0194215768 /NCGR_PEP_ID=MMETSP0156-20130528/17790_1 /TAXON_ID=33649 /ORGANISM="Thalassionema nitzschioides, Strain L26-B" /LENGTH=227 /DNA_ID=CAMNT_0038944373 /DNA_START=18 /DNA_END=701 /DNA_ORIENTATION=+
MGVRHIEENDKTSACDLLSTAVKLILKADSTGSSSTERNSPVKCNHFEWSNATNNSFPEKPCEVAVEQYVFSRGMYVYCQRSKMRHQSFNLSSDAKAAIAYNAGLAYHLLAIEKSDSILLRKASHMYRFSQSILRKANKSGSYSKLCFNYFFHVSILNNLGQISYDLVDYSASTQYFGKLKLNLKHLIAKSMSAELSSRKWDAFNQNDLRGMISNTVIDIPTTAPCA